MAPSRAICKVCQLPEQLQAELLAGWSAGSRASELMTRHELFGTVTRRQIEYHMGAHADVDSAAKHLHEVADLLTKSGIDLGDIGTVDKVRLNEWQAITKDATGEAQIHNLKGGAVVLSPRWESGPEWPVVQPAKPRAVRAATARRRSTKGWRTAVVLPDPQIGYRMFEDGSLDPFHDERATDIALQLIRSLEPDLIVNLGDFLDMSEASRFIKEPAFARTTQPMLDTGVEFLAGQRAAARADTQIVLLEGNHDWRMSKWILENAGWAFGLKPGRLPESWPALSVPHLLRLDELGVEYVSGYPAGIHWINDNLACVHGEKVRSGGSTAAATIDDERVSVLRGHVHRIETHYKTVRTRSGPKTRLSASLGCLCRTDGSVPSTKSGLDAKTGRPVARPEDWQQAVGVVTYQPGDGPFGVEIVPIFEGTAMFRGEMYHSTRQIKKKAS